MCLYSPFLLSLNAPFHIRIQNHKHIYVSYTHEITLHTTEQHIHSLSFRQGQRNNSLNNNRKEKVKKKKYCIWWWIEKKIRNIFYRIFFASYFAEWRQTCLLACLLSFLEQETTEFQKKEKHIYRILYTSLLLPCICNRRITIFFNLSCCCNVYVCIMDSWTYHILKSQPQNKWWRLEHSSKNKETNRETFCLN